MRMQFVCAAVAVAHANKLPLVRLYSMSFIWTAL